MLRRLGLAALVAVLALAPAASAAQEEDGQARAQGRDDARAQRRRRGRAAVARHRRRSAQARARRRRRPARSRSPPASSNAKTYAGQIKHVGGISLTRGDTRVELRNFIINVDSAPDLTARVGSSRVSILDLDLSDAEITKTGRKLKIAGVKATLTEGRRRRAQRRVRDRGLHRGSRDRHRHGLRPRGQAPLTFACRVRAVHYDASRARR